MTQSEEQKNKQKPKKKGIRAPTVRMIKTAQALVANGGKSVADAARQAGYSEAIARNPQKITKTKSWQALMEEYLPQDLIAQKHRELLDAEDIVFIPRGNKILEKKRPDNAARKGAIEMAHKLRGNFAPEKREVIKRKFQDMSNAELAAFIEKSKKRLLKK